MISCKVHALYSPLGGGHGWVINAELWIIDYEIMYYGRVQICWQCQKSLNNKDTKCTVSEHIYSV